jgi:hypothetical protein
MSQTVLVIIGIFFIIGITVGIIAVIAMANIRSDRRGGWAEAPEHEADWPDDLEGGYAEFGGPDGPPRWPEGPDSRGPGG